MSHFALSMCLTSMRACATEGRHAFSLHAIFDNIVPVTHGRQALKHMTGERAQQLMLYTMHCAKRLHLCLELLQLSLSSFGSVLLCQELVRVLLRGCGACL